MDHATGFRLLSATHFATSLLPLTVRLIPVLTAIGRLIVGFRRAELTPQVGHQFETQLLAELREPGRIIVDWTFNHIEPRDRREYSPIRCASRELGIAAVPRPPTARWPPSLARSPSGAILINRSTASCRRSFPWRSAWGWKSVRPHRLRPSALGQAAVTSSQKRVLEYLQRNHGVSWSIADLAPSHRWPVGGDGAPPPRRLGGSGPEAAGAARTPRAAAASRCWPWVVTA